MQQWIKITSSKHHIPDFYALLHLTVPFIPPNPIYHYDTGNKISRMCVYYITLVICHPDFCAKFLKRCIINKEKYRNTDAFVLLEWMGEGETPISRMCVQPNICHSILSFVPNIWGPWVGMRRISRMCFKHVIQSNIYDSILIFGTNILRVIKLDCCLWPSRALRGGGVEWRISRMCLQSNICDSILIFVPNIGGVI